MRISILLVSCVALTLLSGCTSRGGAAKSAGPIGTRAFPMLQIPSMYTSPEDRLSYAAENFWDSFLAYDSILPGDTLSVLGVPSVEVEEQFAYYVSMLEQSDIALARRAAASLFRKVEARQRSDSLSNVYSFFADLAAKYLYDPNSPYRNEDIYLPYVKGLAESPLTSPLLVPAYAHDADMCSLNQIGSMAPDFIFKDIAGRTRTLYGVKGEYTLLFFSNPGCEACRDIIETIKSDLGMEYMITNGLLSIVNVYIDEDIDAWKAYQDCYPESWYNGYDPSYSIRQDLKYNVRAIPSLYLLDADKHVILKDAPEERVLSLLNSIRRK